MIETSEKSLEPNRALVPLPLRLSHSRRLTLAAPPLPSPHGTAAGRQLPAVDAAPPSAPARPQPLTAHPGSRDSAAWPPPTTRQVRVLASTKEGSLGLTIFMLMSMCMCGVLMLPCWPIGRWLRFGLVCCWLLVASWIMDVVVVSHCWLLLHASMMLGYV